MRCVRESGCGGDRNSGCHDGGCGDTAYGGVRQNEGVPDPTGPTPPDAALPVTPLDPQVATLLTRDAMGLVAAVVQEYDTGGVLMLGWMNDEALARTLTTGRVTFWSRSRQELWRKGDTSGHAQLVRSVALDCDGDALLVRVDQVGAACHTGDRSCFDARPLDAVVLPTGQREVAIVDG